MNTTKDLDEQEKSIVQNVVEDEHNEILSEVKLEPIDIDIDFEQVQESDDWIVDPEEGK